MISRADGVEAREEGGGGFGEAYALRGRGGAGTGGRGREVGVAGTMGVTAGVIAGVTAGAFRGLNVGVGACEEGGGGLGGAYVEM